MSPRTVQTRSHNTRKANSRKPSAVTSPKKAKTGTRNSEKASKDEPENWFVVLPSIWVDDIEALITNNEDEANDYIENFEFSEDFQLAIDLERELAETLIEDYRESRMSRDQAPVFYCVLPGVNSGKKAFLTANPRETRVFKEDEDPSARIFPGFTLEDGNRFIEKYNKSKQVERTNRGIVEPELESAKPSVDTGSEGDDDELQMIESTKPSFSANPKRKIERETSADSVKKLAKDATEALELLTQHVTLVLPDFNNERFAFMTYNEAEATEYCQHDKFARVEKGLTLNEATARKECYDTEKKKHLELIKNYELSKNEASLARTTTVATGLNTVATTAGEPYPQPVNPYVTPEKKNVANSLSAMKPPEAPKPQRHVTFGSSTSFNPTNASFHPSFVPLEQIEAQGELAKEKIVSVATATASKYTPDVRSTKKRLTYDEIVSLRQAKMQQQLERTGYDLKISYFQPVPGHQDFVVVSAEIVKSTDGKSSHWLMKWYLAATVLCQKSPKYATSKMWFKTCTSARIRRFPSGVNVERCNSKNYPEHQIYGLVAIQDLDENEPLEQVCKNLAEDLKIAFGDKCFQAAYIALLDRHFPKVHNEMIKQEQKAAVDNNQKLFWDELALLSVKVEGHRSLDAMFLDNDIRDLTTSLYEPQSPDTKWPNEIYFACYRNGHMPSGMLIE